MTRHSRHRPTQHSTTISRRPPWIRSRAGPRSGVTIAKGSRVRTRASRTLSRAPLVVPGRTGNRRATRPGTRPRSRWQRGVGRAGRTASAGRKRGSADILGPRLAVAPAASPPPRGGHPLSRVPGVRLSKRRRNERCGPGNGFLRTGTLLRMTAAATAPLPPTDGSRFVNRELSWLEFNARVLALAEDQARPLLERAKFLAIFSQNLDEFFQVRVSGLEEQLARRCARHVARRLDPAAQLRRDPEPDRRARRSARPRSSPRTSRPRSRRRASGSPTGTSSTTPTGPSSARCSTSACSPSSPRSRSTRRTRSPTSPTSRSTSPCSSATRRRARSASPG